jgi:hypothetical protein
MSGNDLSGKLTAMQVKQAKSKDSTYKLADGRGLNVEIRPNGAKYWRLFYRFRNKQKPPGFRCISSSYTGES